MHLGECEHLAELSKNLFRQKALKFTFPKGTKLHKFLTKRNLKAYLNICPNIYIYILDPCKIYHRTQ